MSGLDRPGRMEVGALHAGAHVLIRWEATAGATGYSLQRRVDGGEYRAIYGGAETAWSDRLPADAQTVRYRVQAYASGEMSWNAREALALSWAQWDARGGLWGEEVSEWTESDELAVTPNTPPAISGEDGHLGSYFEGFGVRFWVEDPDPEAVADVAALLDGAPHQRFAGLAPGEEKEVLVDDAALAEMAIGSVHELVIEATDNNGGVGRRRYTFTVVEDFVRDSRFYLLRDGRPVARLDEIREWTDYLAAAGTHSYVVRGVDRYDNFVDSNEITLTLELDNPVIAPADEPGELLELAARRGGPPEVLRLSELLGAGELQFEGRALPVRVGGGDARKSYSLQFTSLSLEDYEALSAMAGRTVLYRDHYHQRIFGVLSRLEQEHRRRGEGGHDAVVDFSAELREVAWNEVIAYD